MSSVPRCDVAVIGAGIAGLAACVLLRKAGLSVVCLDARPYPHEKVGESLDWSSPGLLKGLGIDVGCLIDDRIATFKRRIVVYETSGRMWAAEPPSGIRRPPLRFETVTLHVDRVALDARVYERARDLGTTFIWDRVTTVERAADRITGCKTVNGRHVEAAWYIDASGMSRIFARALDIPVTTYGRTKVCLWTYFDTPPLHDGTAFFVDNGDRYLQWVWDIPISPTRTSVGFVLPADAVRDRRRAGAPVETILHDELARHERFRTLLETQPIQRVERASFQPSVTTTVCGANWFMVGEAASMPDPLTGNGLTSGIRHARHAVEAICASHATGGTSVRWRRRYHQHVHRLGHAFNAHIERAIYRHALRRGLSLRAATYVYTLFAFFMNALHARFNPRGSMGMAVFAVVFTGASAWVRGWEMAARIVLLGRTALRN